MNKFPSNDDDHYQSVRDQILRMKDGSGKILHDRTKGKMARSLYLLGSGPDGRNERMFNQESRVFRLEA